MSLFYKLARKALFRLDPETAHALSIRALAVGPVRRYGIPDDMRLRVQLAGLSFPNPLGIAAGYDKNGAVPDALMKLGFGHVEIGSVTPLRQSGNPRPRIFRLTEHGGVINRLGFNNDGHEAVLSRLAARSHRPGIVGVNIGANRGAADFVADYEAGIAALWHVASYFTINVSSPNTPGIRGLQEPGTLRALLQRALAVRDAKSNSTQTWRPVFLKISPDLDEAAMDDMAGIVRKSRLDGLVISNTTLSRDFVEGELHAAEAGGLSGRPLFGRSTIQLARMRLRLGPDFPLIGVGGVHDAASAIDKIEAGADLVQLYTGMTFRGPGLAAEIIHGIRDHLIQANGLRLAEIKGSRAQTWATEKLPEEMRP